MYAFVMLAVRGTFSFLFKQLFNKLYNESTNLTVKSYEIFPLPFVTGFFAFSYNAPSVSFHN